MVDEEKREDLMNCDEGNEPSQVIKARNTRIRQMTRREAAAGKKKKDTQETQAPEASQVPEVSLEAPKKAEVKSKKQKRLPLKKRRKKALSDTSRYDGDNSDNPLQVEMNKLRKENAELRESLKRAVIKLNHSNSDHESIPSKAPVDFNESQPEKATEEQKVLNLSTSESGTTAFKHSGIVKPHKVKKLKDLTDVSAMKDFLHDIDRLSLQEQVTAYLDRVLMDKLSSVQVTSNQEILDYIASQVKACEESEDVETIDFWLQKTEFSMDITKSLEVRLNDFYLQMSLAATKIKSFQTNENVRRRFLSRVSAKLDPRLNVTPKITLESLRLRNLKR